MHGLAVYMKEWLLHEAYLYKTLQILIYVLNWFYIIKCLTSFSSIYHHCLYAVFYAISSKIDEVLLIKPSANVFVFGDFNVHRRDWLTYFGGTYSLVDSSYSFSISNDLLRWLTFLLRSLLLSRSCCIGFMYFF